jgi:hypothetical protein
VQTQTAWAILLAPSKKKAGKYERIGIISIEEHFKDAEEMVPDII